MSLDRTGGRLYKAVLTMDTNCSIGVMPQRVSKEEELQSVVGRRGEPRANPAGEALKSWLAEHSTCAASTHFQPRHRQTTRGFGTWCHPRSRVRCQNDHVFVSKKMLPRVNNCYIQAPLCDSDHCAVKLTFRVQVKLSKTPKPSQSDAAKLTDYRVLRPFTPSFDPALTSTHSPFRRTPVLPGIGTCRSCGEASEV